MCAEYIVLAAVFGEMDFLKISKQHWSVSKRASPSVVVVFRLSQVHVEAELVWLLAGHLKAADGDALSAERLLCGLVARLHVLSGDSATVYGYGMADDLRNPSVMPSNGPINAR